MVRGYIRKRSKDSNSIQVYLGRDPSTGREKYHNETVRGPERLAKRRLAEVIRRVESGILTPASSSRLTVGQYLEEWLRDEAALRVRPRTLDGYAGNLHRYVIPRIGKFRLSALTPRHVRSLESGLLRDGGAGGRRGVSARTVLHVHRVLSKALNDAVVSGLLESNVVLRVPPPRALRYEARSLDWKEVHRLIASVDNPKHRTMFMFCLHTGLRRSELLGLRWRDLDVAGQSVSVRRAVVIAPGGGHWVMPPKSGKARHLDLPQGALEMLLSYRDSSADVPDGDSYMFPGLDGAPLRPDHVTRTFSEVASKAGLVGVRFHDLRHTHATLMLMMGVPLKVVSERLGHSGIAITADLYGHVLPTVQRDAASGFEDLWRSSAPGLDAGDPR